MIKKTTFMPLSFVLGFSLSIALSGCGNEAFGPMRVARYDHPRNDLRDEPREQEHGKAESELGEETFGNQLLNIFGDDDREDVTNSSLPWAAIGFLNTGCSATLVGRHLVLTAAHCVYDQDAQALKPELVYFYPNPAVARHNRAATATAIDFVWFGSLQPEKNRGQDWALLYLHQPLGDELGYLSIQQIDFAASLPSKVNVAGYSTDRWRQPGAEGHLSGPAVESEASDNALFELGRVSSPGALPEEEPASVVPGLSVHQSCFIRRIVVGGRHLHDCDATSGVSGGPMFVWGEEGAETSPAPGAGVSGDATHHKPGAKPAIIVGLAVSEYRRGADASVHQPSYTDLGANVAISAAAFIAPWQTLRDRVDAQKGPLAASELAAVLSTQDGELVAMRNPNTASGPVDQPARPRPLPSEPGRVPSQPRAPSGGAPHGRDPSGTGLRVDRWTQFVLTEVKNLEQVGLRIATIAAERRDHILQAKSAEFVAHTRHAYQEVVGGLRVAPGTPNGQVLAWYLKQVRFYHGFVLNFAERSADPRLFQLVSHLGRAIEEMDGGERFVHRRP